jgi:hypothetical protein
MGVTAPIAQCLFGSGERTLGIDHPIGAEQRAEPGGERWGRLERGKGTVRPQFALGVEFAEARHELASEDTAEDFDGQKESVRCGDPALVVGTESAGRDDAVNYTLKNPISAPRCLGARPTLATAGSQRAAGTFCRSTTFTSSSPLHTSCRGWPCKIRVERGSTPEILQCLESS